MDADYDAAPSGKDELVERVETAHDLLEGTLALLDSEQILAPELEGGWSVKDVMAHITAWEQLLVQLLVAVARNENVKVPQLDVDYGSPDDFNRQVFEQNRERSLPDVRIAFNHSYEDVRSALDATPEDILLEPQRFKQWNGESLWSVVAANTYWHYDEHNQQLRDWLASRGHQPPGRTA